MSIPNDPLAQQARLQSDISNEVWNNQGTYSNFWAAHVSTLNDPTDQSANTSTTLPNGTILSGDSSDDAQANTGSTFVDDGSCGQFEIADNDKKKHKRRRRRQRHLKHHRKRTSHKKKKAKPCHKKSLRHLKHLDKVLDKRIRQERRKKHEKVSRKLIRRDRIVDRRIRRIRHRNRHLKNCLPPPSCGGGGGTTGGPVTPPTPPPPVVVPPAPQPPPPPPPVPIPWSSDQGYFVIVDEFKWYEEEPQIYDSPNYQMTFENESLGFLMLNPGDTWTSDSITGEVLRGMNVNLHGVSKLNYCSNPDFSM